ncbi:MAG: mannitol dehydrogenase family protein [Geminicoccaceae bacterium]|nr:mannitol dehydrogenase family protein [Geminicoccaceae bacterium]
MPVKLSLASLDDLPRAVDRPRYSRDALTGGILHIGTGNFHRGHQAIYMDRLFNAGHDRDWAIVGAGVRAADGTMREALRTQDWLTTVVEQEAGSSHARVTGSMIDFVPPDDRAALLAWMMDPAIRIVSMTVTEGGYFINPGTGEFNPDDPEILRDAANPRAPSTAFGLIGLALSRRRAARMPAFTVMSCDNIPHNGVVARNAVAGLARLHDGDLARWIEDNATFPNAMVDRIVPATTDRERRMLAEDFGIGDNWPVFCEDYIQWVISGEFVQGRPALEEAGVQFVDDVTPFEFMKIRILNGGHATIAYPARLLDVHFVHEAMEHPLIGAFLAKVEHDEIIPTVLPVPNVEIPDYFRLIQRRFANPKIGDTNVRLAFDGSSRQPKFILPPIRDQLAAGRSVTGLALESALWCRHCAGASESGRPIEANDPIWPRLNEQARAAKESPQVWLAMADIYGEVGRDPRFAEPFSTWLQAIWRDGTEATIEVYLRSA